MLRAGPKREKNRFDREGNGESIRRTGDGRKTNVPGGREAARVRICGGAASKVSKTLYAFVRSAVGGGGGWGALKTKSWKKNADTQEIKRKPRCFYVRGRKNGLSQNCTSHLGTGLDD